VAEDRADIDRVGSRAQNHILCLVGSRLVLQEEEVGPGHLAVGWVVSAIVSNAPANLSLSHPAAGSASVVAVPVAAAAEPAQEFWVARCSLSSHRRISPFPSSLCVCGGVPSFPHRFLLVLASGNVSGDVVYGREVRVVVGRFLLRGLRLLRAGGHARVCFVCVCGLGSRLLRFRDRRG